MMPDIRIGVCYDFRNPESSGVGHAHLYGEVLEQVQWLDQIGADLVWFTEHHFVDDGYLPSWVPIAAAMAPLTQRVRFGTNICLAPFNHPIRLAEDLAVLDNLSNGRVDIGLGLGYASHEFAGFGIPHKQRVSRTDESIEVLQRCFSGEKFSYTGKRFQFSDVRVTPGYVQEGGPPLWLASMSEAGARRAARYNTHYLPQGSKRRAYDTWVDAIKEQGRKPQDHRIGIIRSILVTDDKARDWTTIRDAEIYRMELYKQFFADSNEGFGKASEAIPQTWIVGDVEHCVRELIEFIDTFHITDIATMAIPPGLRAAQMAPSLEKLFREVVPQVKAHYTKP